MSMTRSNPMSDTKETITVDLVLSKLTRMQVFASGDHSARSYSCHVSRAGPKQSTLKFTRIKPMISLSIHKILP